MADAPLGTGRIFGKAIPAMAALAVAMFRGLVAPVSTTAPGTPATLAIQIVDGVPQLVASMPQGFPGVAPELIVRNVTTGAAGSAVKFTLTPKAVGSYYVDVAIPAGADSVNGLDKTKNLSDLPDKVAALANLGVVLGTAAGNVVQVGADQKIAASLIPAVAITDVFVVASQAAMVGLTAQRGDIAIRSDLSKSFALATDDPTAAANWKELLTPTDAVLSVAGLVGAIAATDLTNALIANGGLSAAAKFPEASAADVLANIASRLMSVRAWWASLTAFALTDAATIAVDLSKGSNFTVTLGTNRTLGAPTNGKPGQEGSIFVTNAGYSLAYASAYVPDDLATYPQLNSNGVTELRYKVAPDGATIRIRGGKPSSGGGLREQTLSAGNVSGILFYGYYYAVEAQTVGYTIQNPSAAFIELTGSTTASPANFNTSYVSGGQATASGTVTMQAKSVLRFQANSAACDALCHLKKNS